MFGAASLAVGASVVVVVAVVCGRGRPEVLRMIERRNTKDPQGSSWEVDAGSWHRFW